MFRTRVYLYDSSEESNGYRGQDFSKNVLQGDENGEDITQELDASEITLAGLPFEKCFDPETKFIIDFVEINSDGTETILETQHRIVLRDISNKPILSDDNYFDHHISLTEPSAIAQKRLVDNIATTYKLKDVSLEEVPAFPDEEITPMIESSEFVPTNNFSHSWRTAPFVGGRYEFNVGKYFVPDGNITITTPSGENVEDIYNNIEKFNDGTGDYYANLHLPKLKIMYGIMGTKNFEDIGSASISYSIKEFDVNDENNPTNIYSGNIISNDDLGDNVYIVADGRWYDKLNGEWLYEGAVKNITRPVYGTGYPTYYYKKYTDKTAQTPSYDIQIPINVDKKYVITISLYQFDDNIPYIYDLGSSEKLNTQPIYLSTISASYVLGTEAQQTFDTFVNQRLTDSQITLNFNLVTYSVSSKTIIYSSSTPYSALALLQKAIINSSIYEKKDNVYIADVNNSDVPFYIDSNFVDDLGSATIIENFYNQKNLWEIMIEVGHYIHAIPELRFGSDDKLIITFNRLGRTDEKTSNSQNVSIYNSRSVEDYISATSSYITNMVQLGGYIEEWVSPKTTNEQLLVSNDTSEIIVTKPIIELLSIVVKNNITGETANLTPYIYEENVYKTLQLDYQINPNRGIAMYYKLGTNVITGGQFQLPQANTNIYSDYSFKKIIYCAFNGYPVIAPAPTTGYWDSIDTKDYSFLIRYRTKDSVRQNHIRPDLRKYLLTSKYDRFPEHNQFNNQTDVVVDSLKFGNNMYGKLIKTGNNSYETTEWNNSYYTLKHKGELYRINGELYYVARVTHYRYSTYILSKIVYSKDYNELSSVIGIPSEPRFYEISEQSLIWREFAINDILLLTDNKQQLEYKSNYVFDFEHLSELIFGENVDFAQYAITVFKGDKDNDKYNQTIGEKDTYIEVLTPINAYSSENTLTYEWDMQDNYSAGDKIVDTDKNEYESLRAVRYTDIFGKAPLLDFYIIENLSDVPTANQIKSFPESPISTKQDDERPFIGEFDILASNVKEYDTNFNGRGIGLLKDCREAMSINFNLQLATNSDTFVLSPYIYLPRKKNVKVVLLSEEVNKLSSGYITNSQIITPTDKNGNLMNPYFDVEITKDTEESSWDSTKNVVTNFGVDFETIFEDVADEHFIDDSGYQRVKSIAILCDVPLNAGLESDDVTSLPYRTQFILARNIPNFWDREKALSPIYFGSPNKNAIFTNKQ